MMHLNTEAFRARCYRDGTVPCLALEEDALKIIRLDAHVLLIRQACCQALGQAGQLWPLKGWINFLGVRLTNAAEGHSDALAGRCSIFARDSTLKQQQEAGCEALSGPFSQTCKRT